ncbi:MAG: lysylphosphatidylglycerol synthase transmembrane domain-containing protein [Phycisphaeraceae bacterium]
MSDPLIHPEEEGAEAPASRWRWVFYGFAVALLVACVYFAVQGAQGEDGPSGWQRLREAAWQDLAMMLGLVVGSVAINGWLFWMILKPFEPDHQQHRPVTLREMVGLIAASSLLNYLPMRAGMIGRAAYLKRLHGVDYKSSVAMLVIVAGATVFVFVLMAAATLWREGLDAIWWATVAAGIVAASVVAVPMMRWKLKLLRGVPLGWFEHHRRQTAMLLTLIMAARAADVLMLAGRLYIAAAIFGTPLEWPGAVVMATGGMLITLATPLPNGLGLREGLYGLFAAVGVAGAAMPDGPMGVAIGLMDRAAEAVVFIVVGVIALAYLHRKQKRAGAQEVRRVADHVSPRA